ncbi:MAG: hypothetical protein LLG09_00790 [Negativicutes bacterium]|nr:hypothetical protein [Negativicutes bacterium]
MAQEGLHILSGSTTANFVTREPKRKVRMVEASLEKLEQMGKLVIEEN